MDNKSLIHLVERAKKDDNVAFAELYSILSPTIYYLGLKITGNEFDANDVVQETMLKVYTNLNKLRNPGAIKSYVIQIANNVSMDILRQKNVNIPKDESYIERVPEDTTEFIPAEYLENEELKDELLHEIQQLTAHKRVVLLLYYYQRMSVKEIAKTLGIKEQLVSSRLFYARKDLKDVLTNRRIKGAMVIAGLPILTRLFTMDAHASYSATIAAANWLTFAKSAGLSVDVAEACVSAAIAPASATILPTTGIITTTALGGVKIGAAILAGIVTIGGAGYFISQESEFFQNLIPKGTEESHKIEEKQENSLLSLSPDSEKRDQENTDRTTTSEKADENSRKVASENSPDPKFQEGTEINNNEESQDSFVSEEMDTDGEIRAEEAPHILETTPVSFRIGVGKQKTNYPLGSSPSLDEVLEKARVVYPSNATIQSKYFQQVDFNKVGEYGFILEGKLEDGTPLAPVAILINIE